MSRNDDRGYKASDFGNRFHSVTNPDGSQIDEILGAGSAGPGKTEILIHDPLTQALVEHTRCENPEYIPLGMTEPQPLRWGESQGWSLFMRRELSMMGQTIERAKRSLLLIDPYAKWYQGDMMFVFTSGYKYRFGHCKDTDSWLRYYSDEYTWIGWDELVQFEKEQYDQINSRLRTTDPVLRGMLKVRSCSNPVLRRRANEQFTVSDPNWVRKYFVDPAPEGNTIIRRELRMGDGTTEYHTRMYMPARLSDNPNVQFRRDYEKNLRSRAPHIQKALIDGDWYITPDSFFANAWSQPVHIVEPFRIPDGWRWFRSQDWGYKRPGCIHWWAMSTEDDLFCVKELTFQGKLIDEVCREALKIEAQFGLTLGAGESLRSKITGPSDDQLWEQRGDAQTTKAQSAEESGISWVRADKRSRRRNSEILMARLHGAKTPTGRGIYFFNDCERLIATLPGIQSSAKEPEVPMDGGEDHWFDSCLYACAYAEQGSNGIVADLKSDYDDDDDDVEKRTSRKWGRWGYGADA